MTDRLAIGGNNPPRHEAFAMALDDVRLEAGNYLDGTAIETQGQADAVGVIVSKAKQIKRDADLARKEDKEPHLEAGRAVDASYKPVLETADSIIAAAQRPLTSYLAKLAAQQAETERLARVEADRLAQEAIAASRNAESIDDIERARTMAKDADKAAKAADRAGKAKAHVAGEGRAIGLRSYQTAVIYDRRALIKHILATDEPAVDAWLDEYARKAMREMPGVRIVVERKVA